MLHGQHVAASPAVPCSRLRQGADAWVNVPHLATDDYVRSMAALFQDKLKVSGLDCLMP